MADLDVTFKNAYPKALATLIRVLGSIDTAEDALQDAMARALEAWPRSGQPDKAVAWLVTAGRRCAMYNPSTPEKVAMGQHYSFR